MADILRNISLFWSLLHCVILFLFLFESRYSRKKTNIITIAVIAPLILLNMVVIIFLGLEKATQLLMLTCIIPSFVLFFILTKNRDSRFIFTFCFVDTIVYSLIVLTSILDFVIGMPYCIVMFISRLLVFPFVVFLTHKYFRTPYLRFQHTTKKGWVSFSIMSITFYVLILTATSYPTIMLSRPDDFPTILLLLVMLHIMYSTVFRILAVQSKLHESINEAQILDMQVKLANDRLLTDTENEHRLRTLRHDLRHHTLLLNDYIKNGETDKALAHISSVTDYIDSTVPKQFCLNGVVNAILSHYSNIAVMKGINFVCEVSLSRQLPLADIAIVVILSNALENAVNALEICDTKRIEIKGFESDGKCFFEIKNPFCGEIEFENDLPVSRRENHGYGTKSIAAIVEKHSGIYSFVVEDDWFVFRCAV